MDYYNNSDRLCNQYVSHKRLRGISYSFVDETSYTEPVTVSEFKKYAYIDFATDDTMLSDLVKSARQQAESYLQKSLGVRRVKFSALECPDNQKLMWGPIADDARFIGDIMLSGGFNFSVEYDTNSNLVNDDIKVAIMAQALQMYQNRGRFDDAGIHDVFKEKLKPYRNITWP